MWGKLNKIHSDAANVVGPAPNGLAAVANAKLGVALKKLGRQRNYL